MNPNFCIEPGSKVLIGMPVYNEGAYLQHTLECIQAQQFTDFQVVISDNCSTDQTFEIASSFAEMDPRFHVVRRDKFRSAAVNFRGVYELCKGRSPYFCWLSGHDYWAPEFLDELVHELENDKDIGLTFSRTLFVDEQGNAGDELDDNYTFMSDSKIDRALQVMRHVNSCSCFYGLHRQTCLEKVDLQIPEPLVGHDHLILAHLALCGKFKRIEKVLYYRRKNWGQQTEEQRVARIAVELEVPEEEFSQKEGIFRLIKAHVYTLMQSPLLTATEGFYLGMKSIEILEPRFNAIKETYGKHGVHNWPQ